MSKTRFTMVEGLMVCGVLLLLGSLASKSMDRAFHAAYKAECMSQLSELYKIAEAFSEDVNAGQGVSEDHDHNFGNWAGLLKQYDESVGQLLMCPADEDTVTSVPVTGYQFHYTWNGGGDIPIAPGPRGKIFKTFTNPKGWRIGLEDWNDADYNDLVVDVRQYDTYLEIETVSADLGGDIHFSDSKGNILIRSLPKKLGQSIRIEGGALTSYGIHSSFDSIDIAKLRYEQPDNTVFMMDYLKSVVYPDEDNWMDAKVPETNRLLFERHMGMFNATFSDGSVRSYEGWELDPKEEGNMIKHWDSN